MNDGILTHGGQPTRGGKSGNSPYLTALEASEAHIAGTTKKEKGGPGIRAYLLGLRNIL